MTSLFKKRGASLDNNNNKKWTSKEIQTLIRGVFCYGENEWQELLADGEDEPTYQVGGYAFHPARSPNELALKWRQLKAVMRKDIVKIRAETRGERIITKHEWMMGVLDKLEKHDKNTLTKNASSTSSADNAFMLDEETP